MIRKCVGVYEDESGIVSESIERSMRRILAVIGIGVLAGCLIGYSGKGGADDEFCWSDSILVAGDDSLWMDSIKQDYSLNDIRFENYEDEDWFDNEYIRTLRRYLDEYSRGEIEVEELDPYRDIVKGRFVINNINPSLWGGMYIQFIFVDKPNFLFAAHVYSSVNEEKREVENYAVRSVNMVYKEYNVTKEEILDSMKQHPELKLW